MPLMVYQDKLLAVQGQFGKGLTEDPDCCCFETVSCTLCGVTVLIPVKQWTVTLSGIAEPPSAACADPSNFCSVFNRAYVQQSGNECSQALCGCEIGDYEERKCVASTFPERVTVIDWFLYEEPVGLYNPEVCEIWLQVRVLLEYSTTQQTLLLNGLVASDPPDPWTFMGGTANFGVPLLFQRCDYENIQALVS